MGSLPKRILLLIATNVAIMFTLSIVFYLVSAVFGIDVGYVSSQYGLNYTSLMLICLFWGMGGSLISLLMSKKMAKWMMRLQVIDPNRASGAELEIVNVVHNLARKAGISKMPEVAIYDNAEVNAFATGPTRNNSLVAVSTGLLHRMNKTEVEGVLGHEVAHIANGDMVTMTLIQGVINAFVMFFARILAFAVSNAMRSNDEGPSPLVEFGLIMLFQFIFGLFGMLIVAKFSRWREFRADAGGAKLAGRQHMIGALQALKGTVSSVNKEEAAIASLKISGNSSKVMELFSTHPPLEKRIARLQQSF